MEKLSLSFLPRFARPLGWRFGIPFFIILTFCGSLSWAKWQDPFNRKWLTLKTPDVGSVECVSVLPKPARPYPVVIYTHGTGGNLMNDGNDLRQITELGMATVSFDYDQTNEAAFGQEFEAVLEYIGHQKWADTNRITWVGFSMGANRMWDFALRHSNERPQLLVQLSGGGLVQSSTFHISSLVPKCSVLLIHGGQDQIFSVEDTTRLAQVLQSNVVPVELEIIPNAPHDMEPNRKLVFRCVGEYCLTHLSGTNAWQNYHSIAEWEQEAPPYWPFCIPAAAWALGCFALSQYRKPRSVEKFKPTGHEIVIRCVAAVLAIWALSDTALHLVPPHLRATDKTLSITRKYLVPPKERTDFEFLAAQPIWRGVKLETLLTHAELANYNRELINWQLDETNYQKYVLSPVITGEPHERFDWRRPLWEEFYPRIRHEDSLEDAATIVVRHLRERVTIADIPNPPREVPAIWLRQITDKIGFQIIYVAALRSVGVPARLNPKHQAEFFDGVDWKAAPAPAVISF